MGAWTSQIATLTNALATKNGRWDERTPKMRPTDMIAVLGMISAGLPTAIRRVADAGVLRSDSVGDDGLWKFAGLGADADPITAEVYMFSASPIGAIAWKRSPDVLSDAQRARAQLVGIKTPTWEPARMPTYVRNAQAEQIAYLREAIDDYQIALYKVADTVRMYIGNTIASADYCKPFMVAVRSLAVDLEVLAETPPTTWAQDIRGGLDAAKTASEGAVKDLAEGAGNAAAWAANTAGQIAGAAAKGFWETADLTTILVAGVVGYVALGRYL